MEAWCLNPYFLQATVRPRLLMIVVTSRSFFSLPSSFSIRAQMTRIWSPVISLPFSSTAISRSPSPSNARPMAAPVSTTVFLRSAVCWEPQSRLMFRPSGVLWMTVRSAPSSVNASGATLYVAPLAVSMAIFMPSIDRLRGKVFFRKTM